ncbi:TRAP transporter small permease subunit [Castellaniella sp.]|uniref:TRAP transporter small permease subunit n=1 Tax=Castellaniella sp. TaxID=1955812 RepID=UPI003C749717
MARVNVALAILAAILLVAATIIITWMVFKRGIGLQSSWELETAIELMISATFLASPYTLTTGGHVKMDLLDSLLSGSSAHWMALLPRVLACGVCFYLGYAGLEMTIHAYLTGERALGIWQPLVWPKYSTVAIGMLLTAFQYVLEIVRVFGERRQEIDNV